MKKALRLHNSLSEDQIKNFDEEATIFHFGWDNLLKTILWWADTILKKENNAGDYNHNYKQTLKYYLNNNDFKDADFANSKAYLHQQKDLIVHLRNLYNKEIDTLSQADNQTMWAEEKLAKINEFWRHIAKLTAFAEVLKDYIRATSNELIANLNN